MLQNSRDVLRIAVLECDEPRGKTKEEYGRFSNVFAELLQVGASRFASQHHVRQPELQITGWDVVNAQEYPCINDVDAVLLTGSRYDAFTPGQYGWIEKLVEFVRSAIEDDHIKAKVIGVCFGHQVIGRAVGIMPRRNTRGWEVAVTSVDLSEEGRQLFETDSLAIHQMHRDVLPTHPPNIDKLGSSELCDVQGLYLKGRLLSLQGHPEFCGTIIHELLDARRGTLLDEVTFQSGKDRADIEHDGVLVASAFVKFIMEDAGKDYELAM